MDLQEGVVEDGFLFERPFSAVDRKILLDVVKKDAPELLQPTAIRRINRDIWERMLVKFNAEASREWSVRQLKMCLQHIVRKTMQRKGGSQAQMLMSRRLQVHRFTSSEKRLLTSLVKNHLVLFSKQKDGDTIMAKRKAWTSVMWAFNRAPGIEGQRTAREIKTCVMNMLNRSKTKDVFELKALIATLNETEMGPADAQPSTQVQIVSIQEEPRNVRPTGGSSLHSSIPMSQPNKFHLQQPTLLQRSHPSTQIIASIQQATPNSIAILQDAIPFSSPGEPANIYSLQASSAQQIHPSAGLYPRTSTATQGQHPPPSTITQDPAAHLVPLAISATSTRGDVSLNRPDSAVQVIEVKDEVISDDSGNELSNSHITVEKQAQEGAETAAESDNVIQLEKVGKEISSFTEPTNGTGTCSEKDGLSNIQIRVHGQPMLSPHHSAVTPPGQLISPQQDHGAPSAKHALPSGDRRESGYILNGQEHLSNQGVVSSAHGSRGSARSRDGVIENRPVGIMGPKRATGRREQSLHMSQRNQQVSLELQESERDPSGSQDSIISPRHQGAGGGVRRLVGGSPRKESLGKMKRRLLQEEHDLRISLMREEHAWHLEEHNWKREEHELRMSMIRINSKI